MTILTPRAAATPTQVVTYQTSDTGDPRINITPAQEKRLLAAGVWPRGRRGNKYSSVYHGAHRGLADFSASDIDRIIAGEHAIIDVLDKREEKTNG
jgi:hypothetical protein